MLSIYQVNQINRWKLCIRMATIFNKPKWVDYHNQWLFMWTGSVPYHVMHYLQNSHQGLLLLTEVSVTSIEIRAWIMNYINVKQRDVITRPWASYQIRKIAGCACARNAGNVFPHCRFQRKPLVSDPGMHHGTCVTHVPWCMSGSLTCGDGENVPGIPGACAPAILRIWQEAHTTTYSTG